MSAKTALVLGASGLIGSSLVGYLLTDHRYERVTMLVRRELPQSHAKLVQRVVNFDDLPAAADAFAVDDVFCCLGTTIRNAGSQAAFYKVDVTYPYEAARLAVQQGAKRFLIVTAMGADTNSRIFYNRVKGEVEEKIRSLSLSAVHILRPSVLLGQRDERRVGEAIAQRVMPALSFLLVGPLKKYRPIKASTVAWAMLMLANQPKTGVHVYESDQLARSTE